MRLGVDIGGTFSDFVLLGADGSLHLHKRLSTHPQPQEGMLAGIQQLLAEQGQTWQALERVAHGSTVATNAILERRGGRCALISTQGLRDVLFIGRQNRPDLYALYPSIPAPLIAREDCYEIPERLSHQGEVLLPLDERALDKLAKQVLAEQYDAIAVCLLYSWVNPEHEQRIRGALVARGYEAWRVALSSDVLPEFREYERASTTALEAYVRPVMVRYVEALRQRLPVPLSLMRSDGGMMSAEHVQNAAVNTALSGPAAGVIGAHYLAHLAGFERILTLDMGGTSTDIALLDGAPRLSAHAQMDGLPLRARLLDIETIGAGGGSIARLDAGGALRVGPQSAGANPGPALYGRGGTQATLTDANWLLGRLALDYFADGQNLHLDDAAVQRAVMPIAQALGADVAHAARGILEVAHANIERAIRRVSVARGHDPREYALFAFGGAGALHACAIAERLGMRQVLVPRYPGVLCAFGLLVADVQIEQTRAVLARASRSLIARLRALQAELLAWGRDNLLSEGITEEAHEYEISLDMRYQGQAYELNVPFESDVIASFEQAHQAAYGHTLADRPIEIVSLRLRAIGKRPKPVLAPAPLGSADPQVAYLGTQPTSDGELARYERERLQAGMTLQGAALILQRDSTCYLPAGWTARVDAYLNLILTHTSA